MKKINTIITSAVVLLLFFSCKTQEIMQQKKTPFMVVESSFTKLVAGEKNQPAQIELSVTLNNLPQDIEFDSIIFKGNTMDVIRLQIQSNKTHTIIVKFDEKKVKTSNYKSLNIDFNHAILFYTIGKKKYFYHLKSIEEKGDINMPGEDPALNEED